MVMAAIILFIFAAAFLVALILNLRYELGFQDRFTGEIYAQLTHEKVERNIRLTKWGEACHKRTTATYSYMVNGVQYNHVCTVIDRFKRMPSSSKLIYQLKNPQAAYLPEFESCSLKGMRVFILFGMLLFVTLGVVAVCM
ncbi:MAG: hypothetical protein IJO31_00790 [Oscillospiraceae bacterium]|nr:hypothetical protein [Oscillospiraceae bacterium]